MATFIQRSGQREFAFLALGLMALGALTTGCGPHNIKSDVNNPNMPKASDAALITKRATREKVRHQTDDELAV